MSSEGNHDLEAATSNESDDATKSNSGVVPSKPSRSILRLMKFTKPIKMPSAPQAVPDGGNPTSCGPNFGLMRRTSDLRNAVEIGDVKLAGEVIDCLQAKNEHGFDGFSIQDVSGNGLLQISALKNDLKMTKMLLDKRYKINDIDSNHGTALQAAIYMNYTAIVDVLLDDKRTPKANVNTAGGYYGCALQVAAFKGSDILVKRLLDLGADVGTCGGKYGSILQAAARTGLESTVNLILDKIPEQGQKDFVNWVGGVYGTALQAAAKGPYAHQTKILRCLSRGRVLKQLINIPRTTSTVDPDYVQVAQILMNKGAEVMYDCGRLRSPIGAAASSGDLHMLDLLVKHDEDVTKKLESSMPPDEKKSTQEQRKRAYSYALINAITQDVVKENRLFLVKSLVKAGADVDFETGSGLDNRPLTAAAAMDATTVIEHLLAKSPDKRATINADSGIYGTALRAALSAEKENAALYLIDHGAAQYVIDQSAGINTAKDEIYGNILHLAVFSEMNEVVKRLLGPTYHMSVDLRDEVGQTALHIAAYRGFRNTVSILLGHKADPDLEDAWGDTPRKIAEDVTERESHPGPSLEDLRDISHQLLVASAARPKPHKVDDLVHGPPIWKKPKASLIETGTAKRVFASPTWNPGLGFKATISDFLQKNGDEYISIKSLLIDDLLYRKGAVDELMKLKDSKDSSYTKNLRWYHLPSNNMVWAHMLMKRLWVERHPKIACKSFWGTDPYFVSPDLAPHARFITPQCERLIPDAFEGLEPPSDSIKLRNVKGPTKYDAPSTDNGPKGDIAPPIEARSTEDNQSPKENQAPKNDQFPEITEPQKTSKTSKITERGQDTLFLAMPYLHWECYRSCEAVSRLLKDIKDESMQNLILRGSKSWRTYEAEPRELTRSTLLDSAKQKDEPATKTSKNKKRGPDDLLMTKYLFKRLPVHLRRTLDQYYYSYLADTRVRDRDQVITKVRNRELYNHKHKPHSGDNETTNSKKVRTRNDDTPDNFKNETPPPDNNSPLVVVDQLWLWVLDRETIITSFPRRRLDKDDGDIDPENKTDVLETILRYLRSAKRHPIRDAYDLSELIISQCVGILHRADVISDLDILEIFGKEADGRVDEVMQKLTAFVKKFKEFIKGIKNSDRIDNKYVTDFEEIFSVTEESLLLREIQDIKDELNMLTAVFKDQLGVLRKAGKTIAEDRERLPETRSSAFNFQQQSEKHARHVERMRVQASQAYDTLKDLLDLKQQQASVLEARASRNQTLAAGEQGKIILVFTIVTIIFLPLTFMTTVFTLPVLTFNRYDPTNSTTSKPDGGLLKSGDTFGIIVGVSLLMAVPAIVVAFQVKRLQVWWENMETKWRKRKDEKQERQKQKGSQLQVDQVNGMLLSANRGS